MSDQSVSRRRRVARKAAAPARPVWETAFRDPVRDSHVVLDGLSFVERHLARIGLVTLALLLGSVLFTDVWRRGALLPLGDGADLTFLPQGLLAVTLVAFLVAWVLLAWGALVASPLVRLTVAVLFVLTNASLGRSLTEGLGDQAALRWGPDLIRTGYVAVPAVLLVSLLVSLVAVRWPRAERWSRPVLRVLLVAALGAVFLGQLWIHHALVDLGFTTPVQTQVSVTINEINGLQLPLVYAAALAVIAFGLDVAEGVAVSASAAPRRVALALLVGLLTVKLWVALGSRLDYWTTYLRDNPASVVRTVVSVAALAAVVWLVATFAATDAFDDANERLLYGSSLAYTAVVPALLLVVGTGTVQLAQLQVDELPGYIASLPSEEVVAYGRPLLAGAAVLAGLWLLRRGGPDALPARPLAREVGSGLVVIGAWVLSAQLIGQAELRWGFSYALADIVVTVVVVAILVLRRHTLDNARIVTLAAVTVFAWLVFSRGDWITFLGGLAGLPAILVVVVGIAFSLAGDSAFTRESSKRLPQGSRILLWVGYLVLSVTILHWVEAAHQPTGFASDNAFFYLGIPLAAWLAGRRLLRPAAGPAGKRLNVRSGVSRGLWLRRAATEDVGISCR